MFLGIDTSCYTTSVAICDDKGRLLCDKRRLLPVEQGQCGLRQSDALFHHTRQLPELIEQAFAEVGQVSLQAVCVSARPRPEQGSYMPVFTLGQAMAKGIAAACSIPCYETSHQEGHIMAALFSRGLEWSNPFLAVHLSGGTGEILRVMPEPAAFAVDIVGDTDLPPGQFVDRVGVALGLSFPAGPQLEELAAKAEKTDFRLSGSVQGTHISFSGPESAAQRAIAAGVQPAQIAAAVLDNIAKSLSKAICTAKEEHGCRQVLLAGGVAANQRIRSKLEPQGCDFADLRYAGDNAVGVALLARRKHLSQTSKGETAKL